MANLADSDQTAQKQSDLGYHCLLISDSLFLIRPDEQNLS